MRLQPLSKLSAFWTPKQLSNMTRWARGSAPYAGISWTPKKEAPNRERSRRSPESPKGYANVSAV